MHEYLIQDYTTCQSHHRISPGSYILDLPYFKGGVFALENLGKVYPLYVIYVGQYTDV